MSPTSFEPLALRAHRLFESRDLDETRERISRVMQPHALLPSGRTQGAAHMDFVRLGGLGIGTIAFGDAMRVQVDAVDGYYLLMFCLSGHAQVAAMGRRLGVDGQTGVLCAPGERFDAVLSADCEQFVLRIDAATVGSLTGNPRATLDPVLHISDAALAAWHQQLMLVARSPALLARANANPRVAAQLEHLLIDLLIEGHPPAAASMRHDPAPGFLLRAQEFVNAHYAQPLQLADIVVAANVPERTLRDAFLQFRGMSPMQYLRATRLEHARELLRRSQPERRIADVALDCGFTHLGRFAIAYREKFGESPSETVGVRR
ncbi:TPA: AraC family transcriptional regulator [Burkholderia vietnamiensis]|uniref:AraC family transcriptional regulator n=1 Tax=Burkholderia vietnamiensis TaxID=60552 RepID=A0ABS1AQH3_BURVI|nr:anthranilate 1,2-dioxygenase regulatory protein AndR [Burkholderia vietnamiensis]MBJ9686371.1 AraC family transcriptional regulator [Burkholderia vietnamiensis]MBR7909379.1 AraC family transcriptional regulator [Burkholderia vietnamiensis]MCA8446003.1 AraC family transcriptional regulator [Burkholderia vietnamiensis]HDR8951682.1 AraC family transcriptional regulator [Burkholderia vietnamiensis]HDR9107568.1 AraC family transcriptional regulator [Burkholderia vietnamiensis]